MSRALATIDEKTSPPWIRHTLILAAAYNVVWGIAVILFPVAPFELAGLPAPNYPALVQCLGMIVGVYGVGYALAARDPVTLWPLVFVGLLGKIFGPIGFVYAALRGEFPWSAGLVIVANDLVWWIPFTAILLQGIKIRDARRATQSGLNLSQVLVETKTHSGMSLDALSRQQPVLLVCVRHLGCTYCREAISDVARNRDSIDAAGARPVIVHMGSPSQGAELVRRFGDGELDHVSDPERRVYRALQLRLGTFSELFGIRTFWRALVGGTVFRFGFGSMVGNPLQMAGVFLIRDGQVIKSFRHQSTADLPDYAELACRP